MYIYNTYAHTNHNIYTHKATLPSHTINTLLDIHVICNLYINRMYFQTNNRIHNILKHRTTHTHNITEITF